MSDQHDSNPDLDGPPCEAQWIGYAPDDPQIRLLRGFAVLEQFAIMDRYRALVADQIIPGDVIPGVHHRWLISLPIEDVGSIRTATATPCGGCFHIIDILDLPWRYENRWTNNPETRELCEAIIRESDAITFGPAALHSADEIAALNPRSVYTPDCESLENETTTRWMNAFSTAVDLALQHRKTLNPNQPQT